MTVAWKVDRTLLREPFAGDVDALLEALPDDWYVTCGFRSSDEQKRLHDKFLAGGPKATSPGNSAHEYGLAVDVTLVVDGRDVWDYETPEWDRMLAAVAAHPRLHSLCQSIGDCDHIQAVRWRDLVTAPAPLTLAEAD